MKNYFIFILTFTFLNAHCQIKKESDTKSFPQNSLVEIDPLRPAKAAFFSAVLPGLGQAYNKKYWKIPIVYGAIGTSTYFYLDNQKKYNYYRNEYKRRLEGFKSDDIYLGNLTNSQLITAQKQFQKNRDLSSLFIIGFYVLNIIEANVDASILQFNVDNRLSIKPNIDRQNTLSDPSTGLTLVYSF